MKFLTILFFCLASSTSTALPEQLYGAWEGLKTEFAAHYQSVLIFDRSGTHLFAHDSLGHRNVFSFKDEDITEHEGFIEISLTRILEGNFSLSENTLSVVGFKLVVVPSNKTGPLYVTYTIYGKGEPFAATAQATLAKSEAPVLTLYKAIEKYLEKH